MLITDHKDRGLGGLQWRVQSLCAVLTAHGIGIATSHCYDARKLWL